jgi:hypothetical protein
VVVGIALSGIALFLLHFSFQLNDSERCSMHIGTVVGDETVPRSKFVKLAL